MHHIDKLNNSQKGKNSLNKRWTVRVSRRWCKNSNDLPERCRKSTSRNWSRYSCS